MNIRVSALIERIRGSLFYVPTMFVVGGVIAGQIGIQIDSRLDTSTSQLPLGLTSTVDSARAVLQTIASATITFAAIAFSISLLVIQMASSQYSPRVVHGLFRDPFNKRVMGLVMGTFTYCLVVLRSVRSALDDAGGPVIPNVSVAVAVLLGLVAILAIVAFIDHSAHSMDVSEILQGVTEETTQVADRVWASDTQGDVGRDLPPDDEATSLAFTENGWIQQIDEGALLELVEDGGVVQLQSMVGRYAIAGTEMLRVWRPRGEQEEVQKLADRAVSIGDTRTMQQDVAYGVRQLADVALKALSPGVNDPTTAQDAIFHLGAVLHELLTRRPPPLYRIDDRDRCLVLSENHTHASLVRLAFDEVRRAAAPHPTVCIYLLEALHLLERSLSAANVSDEAADALRTQAELVVDGARQADLVDADRNAVIEAHAARFGS